MVQGDPQTGFRQVALSLPTHKTAVWIWSPFLHMLSLPINLNLQGLQAPDTSQTEVYSIFSLPIASDGACRVMWQCGWEKEKDWVRAGGGR